MKVKTRGREGAEAGDWVVPIYYLYEAMAIIAR